MTWDKETIRAACLNLSGLIDGVALGGMLFGPPPPNAPARAHLPDDDYAPDELADMPWGDFE